MNFIAIILKVQLAKELGKWEGFPREKSFRDCAQELIDVCTRQEEAQDRSQDTGDPKKTEYLHLAH